MFKYLYTVNHWKMVHFNSTFLGITPVGDLNTFGFSWTIKEDNSTRRDDTDLLRHKTGHGHFSLQIDSLRNNGAWLYGVSKTEEQPF